MSTSAQADKPSAPASASALKGVARGSTANLFGAAVSSVTMLGVTLAVTHGTSPAEAGVFFATTSLFMLATTFGQLGTNTGLVYFLSRARAMGLRGAQEQLYRTATRPVLVVAIGMAVLMFALAPQLSMLINPEHVHSSTVYLRVLAFFIPFAGIENVTLAGTRGLGTMRPNVIVEQLGRPSIQLVLVLTAVVLVDSPAALGLAWALPYLVAAVLALRWWRRMAARPSRPDTAHVDVQERSSTAALRREFWRFTGPRALASVAQMAMQRFDIVLVAALAGAAPAALYTAATRFLVVGQMGNRAISMAVQPRLGASLARGDIRQTRQFYQTATGWLILVAWPLYLVFVAFGEQLLGVFGKGYDAGHGVLLLLSCTMLFATGCGMVDMVLNMAGRTSWNLMNVGLSLGVQLVLDIILIPRHGIMGAAIGWAAGIVCANLVPLLQVGIVLKLHPFGRTTAAAAAVALLSFGLLPAGLVLGLGQGVNVIVGALLVGGTAYAGLLWTLRRPLHLTALASLRRAA